MCGVKVCHDQKRLRGCRPVPSGDRIEQRKTRNVPAKADEGVDAVCVYFQ